MLLIMMANPVEDVFKTRLIQEIPNMVILIKYFNLTQDPFYIF